MKYTIVMETCNREEKGRGTNLLAETIQSLVKSGLWGSTIDFHLVIHDSGSKDKSFLEPFKNLEKTTVVSCENKELNLRNVQYAFTYVLKNHPCDYVINLEDDVIFCKNWIENIDGWIKKYVNDKDIFFSFFTPYNIASYLGNKKIQIWREYKIESFYGNQCLGFPYNQLENAIEVLSNVKTVGFNADIMFQRWLKKYGKKPTIKSSHPCLVQHRNLNTTMSHQTTVLSYSFLGEDIDPELYK